MESKWEVFRLKNLKLLLVMSLLVNILFIGIGSFGAYKQGGMAVVKKMLSSQEYPDYYLQKKNLFESLEYSDVDKIFLGDSITDHGEFQKYFKDEVVLNRGIVEDGTKGILNRLDEVVKRNPKEVYIMIGINDIGKKVDLKVYEANMEKIVQSFNGKSTKVVIQSILPVNNQEFNNEISNKKVHQFNKVLQKIAKENGLQYIDLHMFFEDGKGQLQKDLTVDGIHLTGEGYDTWMENLDKELSDE